MFAGIGGIDLSFKKSGYKIVWANENDKHACYTYSLSFGDNSILEKDIQIVTIDEIQTFDILVAGFPCQAFSSVGLKKALMI